MFNVQVLVAPPVVTLISYLALYSTKPILTVATLLALYVSPATAVTVLVLLVMIDVSLTFIKL